MVAIAMGSRSDWETMKHTAEILRDLAVPHTVHVLSAHRTPDRMLDFAREAADHGYRVIVAGAGGAAHLPGMMATVTLLPVIGVPVLSAALQGLDSLLSIVQMPGGIPVATMAIGRAGAINAGLLAAEILALQDDGIRERLAAYRENLRRTVIQSEEAVREAWQTQGASE
ncbi:phosphoribosylaminoimidazole carboxylase [Sulfobacillus acidophilus TPY]|uniref:N5-carboxyaminoimidazole ribonucleotide mutase n=1 Tax=Sulfobacillus acidophilus (strain ATCC 700253 / DSM 10332 / NAL) TaxID=679936 RepID=G8TWN4_SULAD|nr:phosphoribosylaminoimidazole carboxylase [Sulfobacillus acidophilus TPY]AEW06023.1 5-(carboxyamino)imidazole ribonucleotide mutase [Sulfobacillus acidophilus DSM 10332]